MKNDKKNESGFTLIEIIAVLIILGVLAAVAVPKYYNVQEQAADKAAEAALASAYSALAMGYAAAKLNPGDAPASPTAACEDITIEGTTITSIACTGANWDSGTVSDITVTYTGGSSETMGGSWTVP